MNFKVLTLNNISMDETTTPINIKHLNKFRTPRSKRTFSEFYKEQMIHIKNKLDYIQNGLAKKDIIFENMKKQREKLTHLCEGSRRILSQSREKNKSKEKCKINSPKSDAKESRHTLNSISLDLYRMPIHERLFQERSILDRNRSMLQHKKELEDN